MDEGTPGLDHMASAFLAEEYTLCSEKKVGRPRWGQPKVALRTDF